MAPSVLLSDIVDALEMQSGEWCSFLDLQTGRVEAVAEDLLRLAEENDAEEPDLPGWQKSEWEVAKLVATTDRFLSLPGSFDIHEWGIMEGFSQSLVSGRIQNELNAAIQGAGAFRRFKETVRRRGIEEQWFAYRAERLRRIAIEWCEAHGLTWR